MASDDEDKESNKTPNISRPSMPLGMGSRHYCSSGSSQLPQVSFAPHVTKRHPSELSMARMNSSSSINTQESEASSETQGNVAVHPFDTHEQLVQATIEQSNAEERHTNFVDHINESAALVQRMLGGADPKPQTVHTTIMEEETPASPHPIRDDDDSSPFSMQPGSQSASVFGALMRMETQRRTGQRKEKRKNKVKEKETEKKKLYKMPHISKSADVLAQPVTASKEQKELNRRSWIEPLTKNKHIVPSLEKRKAISAASSRRSSVDTITTTSSQFEGITLEDRVRITYEIANILQKHAFVRKLAKALMQYGCPGLRIESIMRTVARTIQVDCEFIYMPNVMLMSFVDNTMHTTETHFVIQSQTFEMARLVEVYRLEKLVTHGEVSVDEALEFLDEVVSHPALYPRWINPFVYALAAFCGCVMFYGGNWKEGGVSAALAVFFGLYEMFSGQLVSLQPIYEITCCMIVGFIAQGLTRVGFCFTPVAFASFIVLLPGYSMTVGIGELVSRQLVSGVVRMVYAVMYSFLLGFGISMGSSLYTLVDTTDTSSFISYCNMRNQNTGTCITTVGPMWYFLTVPLFAVTYCLYLNARPARWPVMVCIAICGFIVTWCLACKANAPAQVMQVVPAFTVGLLGNIYTKISGKMSFDAVLLGVFYLVPGSLGLKAALGVFGGNAGSEFANQGAAFALSMIQTSIGISVGLFVATLLVYPRGTSHTPLMF